MPIAAPLLSAVHRALGINMYQSSVLVFIADRSIDCNGQYSYRSLHSRGLPIAPFQGQFYTIVSET